jgi:DNA-binding response OmpR family regulator
VNIPTATTTSTRGRVLVADDHELIARLLVHHFEADGFEVISETAAERVREAVVEFQPHLVVVDVHMPPRERFFALRELRTLASAQRPAVIVMSGSDETAIRELATALGADSFLLKPWDVDELRQVTEQLTRRQGVPASRRQGVPA